MSLKLTQEDFTSRSAASHNNMYDYSKAVYLGRLLDVEIICKRHSATFWQAAGQHMDGKTSCHQCVLDKKMQARKANRLAKTPVGSKHCKSCNHTLSTDNFVVNADGSDGYYSVCRKCCAKRSKITRNDPVKRAEIKKISAEYTRNNRDSANAKSATRRANRISRTPSWVDKEFEDFFLKEIYHLAILRENCTGFKWQVDHSVPFQSELVCGMHCSDNMQLIPAFENLSKSNRYWPDMWLDSDFKVLDNASTQTH